MSSGACLAAVTSVVFGAGTAVLLVFYFVYGHCRSRRATAEGLAAAEY